MVSKNMRKLLRDPKFRAMIQPLVDDPEPDGYLFSKELRDHLAPYGDRNAATVINDPEFLRHLCKFAGMSDEKFDEILSNARE